MPFRELFVRPATRASVNEKGLCLSSGGIRGVRDTPKNVD
jgi:hypothetical protein